MNHRLTQRAACLIALTIPLLLFFGHGMLPGRTQMPLDALHARVAPWNQHPIADLQAVSNPVLTDQVLQFEPWAAFLRRELAADRLPLWNPYPAGGVPFAANPQVTVFYPLSTPLAVATPDQSPALRSWLHALVAAVGTAIFLRGVGLARFAAVAGGLLFALSQFMIAWIGYPLGWTMAWLPAWIHCAERLASRRPASRTVLSAAVVVALTALAGHPESLFHITVITIVFAAARSAAGHGILGIWRGPWRLLLAGALGAALAAVLLVPFLEYLMASDAWNLRAAGAGPPALPPGFLLGGLFPNLFGGPADHWVHVNFNERAFSVGVVALLAAGGALLHREAWRGPWPALLALGLVGTAVSFDHGGHLRLLEQLPGFAAAANHRLLGLTAFVVAGLAAVGLDRAARHGLGRRWLTPAIGFYAIAVFLLVGQAAQQVGPLRHVPPPHVKDAALLGLAVAVLAAVVAAMLRHRPRVAAMVLAALAIGELGFWGWGINTVTPAAWRTLDPPEIAKIRAELPVRVVGLDHALLPESGVAHELPTLRGYDALGVLRFNRLVRPMLPIEAARLDDPRLRLVGLSHAYAGRPIATVASDWRPKTCGAGVLDTRRSPVARAFLCGRVETCESEDALYDRIGSPDFDPASGTLLLSGSSPSPLPDRDLGPDDHAAVVETRPDRLVIDVRLTGPAILVVRDAYFPGWGANVDDRAVEIFPAFGGLRGVALPAGDQRVVFTYEPSTLRWGAIVSGLAAAAVLLLSIRQLVVGRRDRRNIP